MFTTIIVANVGLWLINSRLMGQMNLYPLNDNGEMPHLQQYIYSLQGKKLRKKKTSTLTAFCKIINHHLCLRAQVLDITIIPKLTAYPITLCYHPTPIPYYTIVFHRQML